jgi:HAD superfamily hydrolase (TIGR01509 family)
MPAGFPAGVIFDMDGLLLDSERLARDAFVAACDEHGWEVDLAVYHSCIGSTSEATRSILCEHFGENFPYETVDASWSRHYHARLAKAPVPVKPGARLLLELLAAADVPRALATSTRREVAERKLRDTELLSLLPFQVCGGETTRGKPHPDPYLAAAEKLGVEPQCCLALEDSANGVRSAHAAGCMVIQIPDLVPPDPALRELDHLILDSLTEVVSLLEKSDT